MFEVQPTPVFNTKSVPPNVSYKPFKNAPMKNSYCDHRNFDSVNQLLAGEIISFWENLSGLLKPVFH